MAATPTKTPPKPRLSRNPINQTMQDVFTHSAVLRWHGADKDRRTSVPPLETSQLTSAILFGLDGKPACSVLKNHLFREGRLSTECALELVSRATAVFQAEPNVLRVKPPYLVIGDLHGQFYDLINLFESAGQLADGKRFLFLGDYVDRGMFGCETVFYLFALKLLFKDSLLLLRGNHESREITEYFNFQEECEKKYDLEVYNAIMRAFDALPLSCHIETDYGNFLCVHGGLGPSLKTIADIEGVNRFTEPPESGPFCDLLWSDPIDIDEYPQMSDADYETFDFLPNDARGVGWIFGKTALATFLAVNNLECLVRAHEVQQHGYMEHRFGDRGRKHPYCVTVFSAPNYCDMYENRGGIMEFGLDKYSFSQTAWVSHPYWLPDFMNAFDFSLPYVAENTKTIVSTILMNMIGSDPAEEDDPDDPVWKSIQEKFSAARAALESAEALRTQRVAIVLPKLMDGGADHFEEARKIDRITDVRRPKRDKPIHPRLSRKSVSVRW